LGSLFIPRVRLDPPVPRRDKKALQVEREDVGVLITRSHTGVVRTTTGGEGRGGRGGDLLGRGQGELKTFEDDCPPQLSLILRVVTEEWSPQGTVLLLMSRTAVTAAEVCA
jgi:hypothetical protein